MATKLMDFVQGLYESTSIRATAVFSTWTTPTYEQVFEDKTDEDAQSFILDQTQKRKRHRRSITIGIFLTFSILLIPVGVIRQAHRRTIWTSCGDNPETARERGCHFDLISFAWQTPECYDSSLVEEFAKWEPWTFWTSENGTDTVPQEVAFLGERTLWITWHYHIVHCTFVWRRLHRGYEAGWIDSDLRRYSHTKHCQKIMLMDGVEFDGGRFFSIPNDTVITSANIIYPYCEKLGKGTSTSSWWDSLPPR